MIARRVQALASSELNKLLAQFIRLARDRPENTVAVNEVTVPIISLTAA